MELANQFAVARMMNRFPSEIAPVSSLEFARLEDHLHEEAARERERQREMERAVRLKQM